MIGETFGRLTVVAFLGNNKHGKKIYSCLCECGKTTETLAVYLKNGDTKSCGCFGVEQRRASRFKHGRSHKNNSEYEIWKGMKARCYNPNHKAYVNYGGKGTKVCDRWLCSFENFIADMGERPYNLHSADRYPDLNGNYAPDNCRWATNLEQSRNKRNNRWFEINGEIMVMEDWAKRFGVNQSTLWEHLKAKDFRTVYEFYSKKATLNLERSQKLIPIS